MKNLTAKSKKLIDKQFESLGIATDNSLNSTGSANVGAFLSSAGKAIGGWAQDNPEAVLAIADAGLQAATSAQQSAQSGTSNPLPSVADAASNARNQEIKTYLDEFQMMSGQMLSELIAKGIVTPGAQLEAIRNSFADMLYNTPIMSNMKKATLIYLIKSMDRGIATLND